MPKVAYKVGSDGHGEISMVFDSSHYNSQSEADFDSWFRASYPTYTDHYTAHIGFAVNPSKQKLLLDPDNEPTGGVYEIPPPDRFRITSDKGADFDGIRAADADGVDTHTLTIVKEDVSGVTDTSFSGDARVLVTAGVTLSATTVSFVSGSATLTVGPETKICDFDVKIADEAGDITTGVIALRFK
jgi:hypothetical protein